MSVTKFGGKSDIKDQPPALTKDGAKLLGHGGRMRDLHDEHRASALPKAECERELSKAINRNLRRNSGRSRIIETKGEEKAIKEVWSTQSHSAKQEEE